MKRFGLVVVAVLMSGPVWASEIVSCHFPAAPQFDLVGTEGAAAPGKPMYLVKRTNEEVFYKGSLGTGLKGFVASTEGENGKVYILHSRARVTAGSKTFRGTCKVAAR